MLKTQMWHNACTNMKNSRAKVTINRSKRFLIDSTIPLNFMKKIAMKAVHYLIALTVIFSASCTTTLQTRSSGYDDVYYSSTDPNSVTQTAPAPAPSNQ